MNNPNMKIIKQFHYNSIKKNKINLGINLMKEVQNLYTEKN